MKFNKLTGWFFVGCTLIGASSFAGEKAGNGADWTSLDRGLLGNMSELIGPQQGLTEYSKIGVGALLDILLDDPNAEKITKDTVFEFLGQQNSEEAKKLKIALDSLTFISTGGNNVPDSKTGYHRTPWETFLGNEGHCPLAYQDFGNKTVEVNDGQSPQYFNCDGTSKMNGAAMGFLEIHEAFIRRGFENGLDRRTAETETRLRIASLVSDPQFERALVSKIVSTSSWKFEQFKNYTHLYNAIEDSMELWDSAYANPSRGEVKKHMDDFLEIIQTLGLPCEVNSDSQNRFVNEIVEDYRAFYKIPGNSTFEASYQQDAFSNAALKTLCNMK
jgi:hypothetical protein